MPELNAASEQTATFTLSQRHAFYSAGYAMRSAFGSTVTVAESVCAFVRAVSPSLSASQRAMLADLIRDAPYVNDPAARAHWDALFDTLSAGADVE